MLLNSHCLLLTGVQLGDIAHGSFNGVDGMDELAVCFGDFMYIFIHLEDDFVIPSIFDEFFNEAGPSVGKTIDRKSCNIAIPINIPQGFSVSVISVDYRGFVSLPSRRSTARLSAEYFFAGQRGPVFGKTFMGSQDTDYTFSNDISVVASIWSQCGASPTLRVNTSMLLKNTDRYEDALATVDSADFSAGIIYHLQWRRCR